MALATSQAPLISPTPLMVTTEVVWKSGKLGQSDKWIIPPHRGLMVADRSEEHDETSTPDPLTGVQG